MLEIILIVVLVSVLLAIFLLPVFICFEILGKLDWNVIKDTYKTWVNNG